MAGVEGSAFPPWRVRTGWRDIEITTPVPSGSPDIGASHKSQATLRILAYPEERQPMETGDNGEGGRQAHRLPPRKPGVGVEVRGAQ